MISGQHGLPRDPVSKTILKQTNNNEMQFSSLSNDLAKRNGNDHGPLRAYMACTIRDLMSDNAKSIVM